MDLRLMKMIIFMENMLCVYRNYCTLTITKRLFIWLRISCELLLVAIILSAFSYDTKIPMFKTEFVYYILNIESSITIMLLAVYHSQNFKKFKLQIERNHEYFANDSVYLKDMNKIFRFIAIVIGVYLLMSVGVLAFLNIYSGLAKLSSIIGYFIYVTTMSLCRFRFTLEYIALYCLLILLSEQVKCITRKIRNVQNFNFNASADIKRARSTVMHRVTDFDEWATIYTDIKECSDLINTIFGVQITITMFSLIFYFIKYLYVIADMIINGDLVSETVLDNSVKTIIYLIALYALSRGAQTAENSAKDLRRCLGKLLIFLPIDDGRYKATKDFLRLVTNRPIKTKAFGSINVDMTLIPKFVMFFTSYTVIALQFNNVL